MKPQSHKVQGGQGQHDALRDELQGLAHKIAARHEEAARRRLRASTLRRCLPLLVVVPLVYAGFRLVLGIAGVDFALPLGIVALLTLALPALAYRIGLASGQRRARSLDRFALAKIDDGLGLDDRLGSAYEFAHEDAPTPMMQAAIDDARRRLDAARAFSYGEELVPLVEPRRLGAFVASALLVLVATLFFGVASGPGDAKSDDEASGDGAQAKVFADDAPTAPQERERMKREEARRKDETRPSPATLGRRGDSGVADKTQKEARGDEGSGKTSEAQSTSGQSAGEGASTEAALPTKGEAQKKPTKKAKPPKERDARKKPSRKPDENKESVATTGQGRGKGSSRSPTASEWSSKDQSVAEDEEELEEEADVDDDEDESDARGGLQPNLRQRKPPVNRDLSIGFGGGKPPPNANGRGGPGMPKKQRGVAQLVLGIPYPDQITGKPNKGRTKVTQERIDPQAQDADAAQAAAQTARSSSLGPLARPILTPWMQDVVRAFGLEVTRTASPLGEDHGSTSR